MKVLHREIIGRRAAGIGYENNIWNATTLCKLQNVRRANSFVRAVRSLGKQPELREADNTAVTGKINDELLERAELEQSIYSVESVLYFYGPYVVGKSRDLKSF